MKNFLLLLLPFAMQAQNVAVVQWAFGMGGSGNSPSYVNEVTSVTYQQNSIITCGNVAGTIDLDPAGSFTVSTASNTIFNPFVASYDTLRNFQWGFSLVSPDNGNAKVVETDAAGNIYLAGEFTDVMDADPSASSFNLISVNSGRDMFIAKYSPTGAFTAAIAFGGNVSVDAIEDMIADQAGNIYITGTISDSVDFDPSPALAFEAGTAGGSMYLAKYNSQLDYQWSFIIDSDPQQQEGQSLAFDASGNIVAGMQYHGTVDIDPSVSVTTFSSQGSRDYLVMKYDTAGNYISAFSIGGPVSGPLISEAVLTVDLNDNIIVSGRYNGTIDIDPGPDTFSVSSGNFSFVFVGTYTSTGEFRWGKNLGNGAGTSYAYNIKTDVNGSVYLGWSFLSYPQVTKYDSSGVSQYNKSMLSSGNIYSRALYVERPDVFYAGGGMNNSLILDSTFVGSNSGYTAFLARYAQCLPAIIHSQAQDQTVCEGNNVLISVTATGTGITYSWYRDSVLLPANTHELLLNEITSADSGNYYCIVNGSCGTDTSTAIHLTVLPLPAINVIQSGNQLNATAGLSSYQWYYNGMPAGSNSSTHIPTGSGVYYVIGTNSFGCSDTSNSVVFTSVNEEVGMLVKIYPTPAHDYINVSLLNHVENDFTVTLTEHTGRVVMNESIQGNLHRIDSRDLASGHYFIQVWNADHFFIKSVIIY